ncbi:MAG: tetratricopeptide repeat protein [Chloroflexia bacterium]|nr:tetratricopeptide repeat protein [Chloroflexia bacterium]
MQIRLFGSLTIAQHGEPVTGFVSNKVAALLAYLAVTRCTHQRDALAGLLWGEMAEADARNNLRQALSNLRKLAGPYVTITRTTTAFHGESPYTLDVEQFERHLGDAETAPDPAAALQAAVSFYQGDFLAGFYLRDAPAFEEWALLQRERYRSLALHALHTLTAHYLRDREYARAIDSATQLLALDSWREETHRQLMLALARSGQRSAALSQYQACRRILAEELEAAPSAETTRLYERIRAAGSRPHNNLPTPSTPLVGREDELARIQRWLADENSRLLTVIGPGGVGKTRLALQAAWAHPADFLEGVWFVPLVAVTKEESWAQTTAAAIGFRFSGAGQLETQLLDYLRGKEMLLLLDNVEHLLDELNLSLFASLIAHAPGIKLMVTSRERLNLRAETLLELDGLACPGHGPVPRNGAIDPLPDVTQFPAAQLFVARAQQVKADFSPAGQEAALARLCQLVGGLPLALELAASWVRALDVAGIVEKIAQGLDFLSVNWPDLPARHRSLQAGFEHSWQLLTPRERDAYARLAVFRGGFTAEAAEAVAGASLSLLAGLVDKSLLYREGRYYRFHPLLLQFAADKLAADVDLTARVKGEHARYYGRLIRGLEPTLFGGSVGEALDHIRPELNNLRLAWQTAVEHRETAILNDLADSFMQLFDLSGLYREMRDMAMRAIRALAGQIDPAHSQDALALGRAYGLSAAFHFRLGENERAKEHGQTSLEIIAPFQPHVAYGHSLMYTGAAIYGLGDLEQATAYWQKGADAYRQAGSIWGECAALTNLSEAMLAQENLVTSRQYATAAHTLARQMDNRELQAVTLQILAVVALRERDFEQAVAHGKQAAALHRRVGHQAHVANALAILARIAAEQGDPQQALAYLDESTVVLRQLGNLYYLDLRLVELGRTALEAKELERAEAALQEILGRADFAHIKREGLEALLLLAELRRRQGALQKALRLATFVTQNESADDEMRARAESCLQSLAGQLTADEIAAAESSSISAAILNGSHFGPELGGPAS